MQIEINDDPVELLSERAVYLPRIQTLLVADLHWGKTDVFVRSGVPLPAGILASDLARLTKVIEKTKPEKVLILGDLVHNSQVLGPQLHDEIAAWRILNPLEMILIPGNHDRGLAYYADWKIHIAKKPELEIGDYLFCHDEGRCESKDKFIWGGHIHPTITLTGGGDRVRVPCFVIGKKSGLLPAFSRFTGGHDINPRRNDRIYVIADNEVVAI